MAEESLRSGYRSNSHQLTNSCKNHYEQWDWNGHIGKREKKVQKNILGGEKNGPQWFILYGFKK